jgi:hypothetical protein
MARTEVIRVRVASDEKARLQMLAKTCDRSVSSVLRQLIKLAEPAGPDLRLVGKLEVRNDP